LTGTINDHSYTPAGTLSHSFSYTATAITDTSHSLTAASHTHTFNGSATTFSTTYTPAGTISGPSVTVSCTSSDITYLSDVVLTTASTTSTKAYYDGYTITDENLEFTSSNPPYIKATGISKTYTTSSKYLTSVTVSHSGSYAFHGT